MPVGMNAAGRPDQAAIDPLNTTYLIEGKAVFLTDGRHEIPATPSSAMKMKTAVFGRPVVGDLDGDGDQDAVLLLTHDPGGSGTFYYVAAATNRNKRYQGTNAILLGDRISPMGIAIRNGVIVVRYADRRPEEPMSISPSVGQTMVLTVKDEHLIEMTPPDERGSIVGGWLTIGHEVRTFKPCDSMEELWLMGQSPAMKAIKTAYRSVVPYRKPFQSVFMVLAGETLEPPTHGFGADYEAAYLATHLVWVFPGANCTSISPDIDSPESIQPKITFDMSVVDKDGLFGPLGGKRALSYEFCIPDSAESRTEVEGIDPTVTFFSESPGRIGCRKNELLCIGSTHQKNFATVLQLLAELPYVQRIEQSFFE